MYCKSCSNLIETHQIIVVLPRLKLRSGRVRMLRHLFRHQAYNKWKLKEKGVHIMGSFGQFEKLI